MIPETNLVSMWIPAQTQSAVADEQHIYGASRCAWATFASGSIHAILIEPTTLIFLGPVLPLTAYVASRV
jgi:fumarate reductase subunit D